MYAPVDSDSDSLEERDVVDFRRREEEKRREGGGVGRRRREQAEDGEKEEEEEEADLTEMERQRKEQMVVTFKILEQFDIDKMKDLFHTRNWDLIYAVNETGEKLNDLVLRERNLADLDTDEMAYLEKMDFLTRMPTLSLEELAKELETNLDEGLSETEAEARQARDGLNRLSGLKRASKFGFYLKHLFQGPAVFWWMAATLVFTLLGFTSHVWNGNSTFVLSLALGLALLFISFVTGTFAYWLQPRPPLLKPRLTRIYPKFAKVRRGGKVKRIEAEKLVVGDVVELRIGDRIPADLRMISSHGMFVSQLNGVPDLRPVSSELLEDTSSPLDAHSLVFYGSHCAEGSGVGVVFRTGDRTLLGTLAQEMKVDKEQATFLQRDTSKIFMVFFFITMVLVISVLFASFWRYSDISHPLSYGALTILAMLPSGLMISGYLIQLVGAWRVSRQHVEVNKVNSLDALGRISALCVEKPGFLTEPQLFVTGMWYDGETHPVDPQPLVIATVDEDLSPRRNSRGKKGSHHLHPSSKPLISAIALCSQKSPQDPNEEEEEEGNDHQLGGLAAKFGIRVRKGKDKKKSKKKGKKKGGDPDEGTGKGGDMEEAALLEFADRHIDVVAIQKQHPRIYSVPFSSSQMSMLSISRHRFPEEGVTRLLVVFKGSPDAVLTRCSTLLINGQQEDLLDDRRVEILRGAQAASSRGDRVVAFCQYFLNPFDFPDEYDFDFDRANFPLDGYCFLGFISLGSSIKYAFYSFLFPLIFFSHFF